jgi:phosphoglycerate dehydrogenase-like enzyme
MPALVTEKPKQNARQQNGRSSRFKTTIQTFQSANSTPPSKSTTHFLSTPEFALLHSSNPSGTHICNIARGAIIDQAALIHALETKQIRAASLDVTDPEPLPKDDPLWDAPNVLITPHVSGSSEVYAERAFEVLRENLRRDRDGRGFVNLVDRGRGY